MDDRPVLYRTELRRRPSLGDILPPLLAVLGSAAFLALIVAVLVWVGSNAEPMG